MRWLMCNKFSTGCDSVRRVALMLGMTHCKFGWSDLAKMPTGAD